MLQMGTLGPECTPGFCRQNRKSHFKPVQPFSLLSIWWTPTLPSKWPKTPSSRQLLNYPLGFVHEPEGFQAFHSLQSLSSRTFLAPHPFFEGSVMTYPPAASPPGPPEYP